MPYPRHAVHVLTLTRPACTLRWQTLESDGNMKSYTFKKGDAIIFPSYKFHSVAPVTGGCRRTLILELWRGDTKHCDHRCDILKGAYCDHV